MKLLDHVRGNDELDIILNEEGDVPDLQEHGKLTRLKLALKFNEKHVSIPEACKNIQSETSSKV